MRSQLCPLQRVVAFTQVYVFARWYALCRDSCPLLPYWKPEALANCESQQLIQFLPNPIQVKSRELPIHLPINVDCIMHMLASVNPVLCLV
jgi:hypothetical protein